LRGVTAQEGKRIIRTMAAFSDLLMTSDMESPRPFEVFGWTAAPRHDRCHRRLAVLVLAAVSSVVALVALAALATTQKGQFVQRQLQSRLGPWAPQRRLPVPTIGAGATTERRLTDRDQCHDESYTLGIPFKYLSPDQRSAWSDLGWTEMSWDFFRIPTTTGAATTSATATITVPGTETMCWADLSPNQRDAAVFLGYSIQGWHACKNQSCPWPLGIPLPTAPCMEHLAYLESKMNFSSPFMALPPRTRSWLQLLGWDADGVRWAKQEKAAVYAKRWGDLEYRERESALNLGYTAEVWDGCESSDTCLARLEILENEQKSWVWETMPRGPRNRLAELGWQSRSWFEGEAPLIWDEDWLRVSYGQRVSLVLLGHRQDTWAGCPVASCIDRFEYVKRKYQGIGWMEMRLAQRRAWMLLGHSAELWAAGKLPTTMQKRWEELRPEQQEKAAYLGHSHSTWQGCSIDWVSPDHGVDNATTSAPPGASGLEIRMVIYQVDVVAIRSNEEVREQLKDAVQTQIVSTAGGDITSAAVAVHLSQLPVLVAIVVPPTGINPNQVPGDPRWNNLQSDLQSKLRGASFAANITLQNSGQLRIESLTVEWAPPFTNHDRPVRARMTIQRAYSEISGNIYGTSVADLPTSFISVFENAVARALFCGNPPLSHDSDAYVVEEQGPSGTSRSPLCVRRSNFEMQKHRVRVASVVEGSIVVVFYLVKNQTIHDPPAPMLFEALQRQVESETSPLAHDMEFGRFARAATLEEIKLSDLEAAELEEGMRVERVRKSYDETNMCNLQRSAKEQQIKCIVSAAFGARRVPLLIISVAAATTFLGLV